jgi:hypothetical protein
MMNYLLSFVSFINWRHSNILKYISYGEILISSLFENKSFCIQELFNEKIISIENLMSRLTYVNKRY